MEVITRCVIDIETGNALSGQLPKRAQALVAEWYAIHKAELLENWKLARQHKALKNIAPLE